LVRIGVRERIVGAIGVGCPSVMKRPDCGAFQHPPHRNPGAWQRAHPTFYGGFQTAHSKNSHRRRRRQHRKKTRRKERRIHGSTIIRACWNVFLYGLFYTFTFTLSFACTHLHSVFCSIVETSIFYTTTAIEKSLHLAATISVYEAS
jgi:hypothetical protein